QLDGREVRRARGPDADLTPARVPRDVGAGRDAFVDDGPQRVSGLGLTHPRMLPPAGPRPATPDPPRARTSPGSPGVHPFELAATVRAGRSWVSRGGRVGVRRWGWGSGPAWWGSPRGGGGARGPSPRRRRRAAAGRASAAATTRPSPRGAGSPAPRACGPRT